MKNRMAEQAILFLPDYVHKKSQLQLAFFVSEFHPFKPKTHNKLLLNKDLKPFTELFFVAKKQVTVSVFLKYITNSEARST